MRYALDSSVLVRVLARDPEPLATDVILKLEALREAGHVFVVSNLVLAETYYAVCYHYRLEKKVVLDALHRLSQQYGFEFTPEAVATLSLANIDRASPGFVDRLIHGEQHAKGISVLSCEKSFRKLPDAVVVP